MNRFSLRTLIATSLLAATAAASAASFPVASGEFSAADVAASNTAQPVRAARATTTEGRTRAEVRAELEAARCRGELPFDGETGRTYRDVFPGRYPLPECR